MGVREKEGGEEGRRIRVSEGRREGERGRQWR